MTEMLQPQLILGSLLSPDKILIINEPLAKKTLIARLVQVACRGLALDVDEVTSQVLKHEESFVFTLETGLSIPHARVENLDSFCAAMAVLQTPLMDEANLHAPTRVLFLFLSPGSPAFFKPHLQLLASLIQTFQPAFVQELAVLKDPGQIVHKITQQNMVK